MWTVLSGVFGGLLRLFPEIIKAWNRKMEMAHELNMQKVAYDFQVLKGKQEVDMIVEKGAAEYAAKGLDALSEAIRAQAKPSGVKWVDGLSAFIRPMITIQWVIILYPAVIVTTFVVLIMRQTDIIVAMNAVFGAEEKALIAFIVDFWFVGRTLEVGRKIYSRVADKNK